VPLWGGGKGELGPHPTECRQGRGLPPTKWHIQSGPKKWHNYFVRLNFTKYQPIFEIISLPELEENL